VKLPRIVFLRADLKETNILLARIAHALEVAVGIAPAVPIADDDLSANVAYSTVEDLLREEFAKAEASAGELR